MPDCDSPVIASGTRRGPMVVLTLADGHRLALRDSAIKAIDEVADGNTCRLILTAGEELLVDADLDAVLGWLTGPLPQR